MPPPADGLASRLFLGPALRTQSDRRLVTLVREGYEAAFEEIVRRYAAQLRRYATAIVGGNAEDVTQDSFSKALLALRRDDTEIELRPWLYRIVRNTALNDLRDHPRQAEALAETIAAGQTPAEELEQREELTDLMHRLRALPEAQRAAIVMRELEGLGHDEIAAALGISGGAARQAIHRARTALRNGVGMLLPLPLLRLLIDHAPEAVAAGMGAGGTTAAASGALGGAGAGTALKAGVVTAVLAGSVGTGLALNDERPKRNGDAVPAAATAAPAPSVPTGSAPAPATTEGSDDSGSGPDSGGDHRGGGGPGSSRGEGNRERAEEPEREEDSSGHSGSSRSGGSHESHSGPGGGGLPDGDEDDHSGPGGGGDDGFESSGPGSGTEPGEGSSGSGSSGSGDDDYELDDDYEVEDLDDD